MGQYYKGTKIGTCETMYYMRLSDAQKLADLGACDDDQISFKEYLEDNTTRFRFPFPDEDDMAKAGGLFGVNEFDRGFELPAGDVEVGHNTICVSNSFKEGGSTVNIFIPCPYSKEFTATGLETSRGGAGEQYLTVRYQAMRDGQEKTIFACARCGSQQRFSDDDVVKIKERALEYFKVYDRTGKSEAYGGNQGLYDYAIEVINRIK